jgi:hypothetical protein
MKINQRVEIEGFYPFDGLTATVIQKVNGQYSEKTNGAHEGVTLAYGYKPDELDLYLIQFDAPIIMKRKEILFGEEMMVFGDKYLKCVK